MVVHVYRVGGRDAVSCVTYLKVSWYIQMTAMFLFSAPPLNLIHLTQMESITSVKTFRY